ncbi:hypothetical protein [Listeria aquatica]|uniref:Uncharacterized protein n=1 Tax=Listeria aquatica FSL S10-1188 TaxID=1265818 RepID=W7B3U9_9LIST|nr:hypothetical protein [Listeria aquatica]EUJ20597.1 hypothetical protein MAQA_04221 [Listeria aquatica FSL S10-1188]
MKLTASDFDALYLPEKQFRKLKEIYTEEEIDILKKRAEKALARMARTCAGDIQRITGKLRIGEALY